jgi:hypothetical protein
LRMAKYHVERARQIVAEQRQRIARLYDRGHSIQFHETLLAQFEGTRACQGPCRDLLFSKSSYAP